MLIEIEQKKELDPYAVWSAWQSLCSHREQFPLIEDLTPLDIVVSKIFCSEEGRYSNRNIADSRREHEVARDLLSRRLDIFKLDEKRVRELCSIANRTLFPDPPKMI